MQNRLLAALLSITLGAATLVGITPTSASFGTTSDDVVYAWGYNGTHVVNDLGGSQVATPQPVLTGTITQVAGGYYHAVALAGDGTLYAWGSDTSGQLGDGTVGSPDYSAVPNHLTLSGTIVQVAAGYYHTLALVDDGTVYAWGRTLEGQLGYSNGLPWSATPQAVSGLPSTIVQVAAGRYHSLALADDGTLYTWGDDSHGQLGDGTVGSPSYSSTPYHLTLADTIVQIAGGESHSLALADDGTLYAWGWNMNGQLGDGTLDAGTATPQTVDLPAGVTIVQAEGGLYHTLALADDGTLYAWGYDYFGQLGDGASDNSYPFGSLTPQQVNIPAGVTITYAAAGNDFSLAISGSAPENTAPVAMDDSYTAYEAVPLEMPAPGVLGNDTDADSDPLTATIDTTTTSGTLTLNPDGSFTYTATPGFFGADTFTYHATDGVADSNVATVTITVADAPEVPPTVSTGVATSINGWLSSGDVDLYQFCAAGFFDAEVTAFDGDDTELFLFDGSGSPIAENDDGYSGQSWLSRLFVPDLPLGSYLLAVGSWNTFLDDTTLTSTSSWHSGSYSGSYEIELSGVVPCGTDCDDGDPSTLDLWDPATGTCVHEPVVHSEVDDAPSVPPAQATGGRSLITGWIDGHDVDLFEVCAVGGATPFVATVLYYEPSGYKDGQTYASDSELFLFGENGYLVGENDQAYLGNLSLLHLPLDPGTYLLAISSYESYPDEDPLTAGSTWTALSPNSGAYVIELSGIQPCGNQPPVAVDDIYTAYEAVSLEVPAPGVLGNDTDADSDPLTATIDTTTTSGTLTLNPDGSFTYTAAAGFLGDDTFTYHASDGIADSNVATATITVTEALENTPPVAVDDTYTTDEDTLLEIVAPGMLSNDYDPDFLQITITGTVWPTATTLTATLDDDVSHGSLTFNSDGSFSYDPDADFNGTDWFTYHASDGIADSNVATATITVAAVNDAPEVVLGTTSRTVQYSDAIEPITVTVTDIDSPAVSTILTGGPDNVVLVTEPCTAAGDGASCAGMLTGTVIDPEGDYELTVTVSDGDASARVTDAIIVTPENASVRFDLANPISVRVDEDAETAGTIVLTATVVETNHTNDHATGTPYPGDVAYADVDMVLAPVGPGSTVQPLSCSRSTTSVSDGYDQTKTLACTFTNVPVNTYTVEVEVTGGYYIGAGEDVLTVYDPNAGFATGGGWFTWPDTGERTNFGFTMKYNKKATNLQGSLLLIRHLEDGTIYRVKSNALYGLAVGEDESVPMGWATFNGKATYLEPDWTEPIGNYEFVVAVEDLNEPGAGIDTFQLRIYDQDGVLVGAMTMAGLEEISGGNITVPHQGPRTQVEEPVGDTAPSDPGDPVDEPPDGGDTQPGNGHGRGGVKKS